MNKLVTELLTSRKARGKSAKKAALKSVELGSPWN